MAKGRKGKKRKYRRWGNNLLKTTKRSFAQAIFSLLSFVQKGLINLPPKLKRSILASLMFLLSLICFFSFFGLAGKGGESLRSLIFEWFGYAIFVFPLISFLLGLIFLSAPKKLFFAGLLSALAFSAGVSGLLGALKIPYSGGKMGDWGVNFLVELLGKPVSLFSFLTLLMTGGLGFWYVIRFSPPEEEKKEGFVSKTAKRILAASKFKISRIEPEEKILVRPEEGEGVPKEVSKVKGFKVSLPPFGLLEEDREKARSGNLKGNSLIIKKTLGDFGMDVSMAEVNIGPTVTQYTLKPPEGVKLSKITGLSNNLALALAAHPIRIEAPIPGRSLVGIEIPNETRGRVRLRNLISHQDFKSGFSNIGFALGRDVAGSPVFADLSRLPHLLVAGATGTGKTIFLNSLILSLLYRNTPQTLRLILIDPKRVEFSIYKDLPHLLSKVIFTPQETINALSFLVDEMERRFSLLSEYNTRNIYSFNEKAAKNGQKPLYSIVLIVDELADLMASRGKELETRVVRIAQMARAVGIHLVIATQRPSTEVITGLIKANITSRVSFQLPTQIDSRTVLDMGGAEKLLGLGDMLYVSAERSKPRRIQGAYVSEKEVKRIADWIKKEIGARSLLEDDLTMKLQEYLEESGPERGDFGEMKKDPIYGQAKEIVVRNQKASASLLQRRLQIGYVRAARLLDMLEAEGVIGPAQGAKPRKVFFKSEDDQEILE